MTTPIPQQPGNIHIVKKYFGVDREVTNKELLAFKKAYPTGLAELARGIEDGTLTY